MAEGEAVPVPFMAGVWSMVRVLDLPGEDRAALIGGVCLSAGHAAGGVAFRRWWHPACPTGGR